ncbi:hypothetical protein [uncultured Campylobacter sp.]|uniref:hypothetical protein n=1 Tax=uncultured Campylobacter sp. TaxID=218934 RepID=UPI00260BDE9F|nr:hypothetical protein [uncultured Campylobacter sp.]
MYREFFIVIIEYFKNLKSGIRVYEVYIPLSISLLLPLFGKDCKLDKFLNSSMTLISVLVGFTIAAISILLTSNLKSIEKSRKTSIDKFDFLKRPMTLFKLILSNLFYCILIGFFILIFGAICVAFNIENTVAFIIDLFFTIHILLVIIRNLVNLFLIAYKDL